MWIEHLPFEPIGTTNLGVSLSLYHSKQSRYVSSYVSRRTPMDGDGPKSLIEKQKRHFGHPPAIHHSLRAPEVHDAIYMPSSPSPEGQFVWTSAWVLALLQMCPSSFFPSAFFPRLT